MIKYCLVPIALLVISCSGPGGMAFDRQAEGKKLSFQRSKGNCLACHRIEDGDMPGNIGPPLTNIQSRFSNKRLLREQIWDAAKLNPNTSMPPFGKNKILSEQEIDLIVDYIWSL